MKTIEQLKDSVSFHWETVNDFNKRIVGTLEISASMTVDMQTLKRYGGIEEHAKDKIKEKIIRDLYEDGRHVMSEMLVDLARCEPWGIEFGQKMNEVIALAKRIQPGLLPNTNTQ